MSALADFPTADYELTVPLPASLPSPNSRMHWRVRAKLVKDIRRQTAILLRSEMTRLGIPEAAGCRTLRLTRIYSPRRRLMDTDNLTASVKPCLDGARDAALIVDDTTHWLRLLPVEQEKGERAALRVEVWEG